MSPDELVQAIFARQLEQDPHSDPGDMHITIQDDMDMVRVQQDMVFMSDESSIADIVKAGGVLRPTIQSALEHYYEEVENGDR